MDLELEIREIDINDFDKGYLDLLSQLTKVENNLLYIDLVNTFNNIKKNDYHKIFVIENNNKIIGTITILIELKFTRNLGKVCHIEDLVVSNNFRSKGIGKKLLNFVIDYSKKINCYKIILNCSNNNKGYYEKIGFDNKNNEMSLYL